MGGEIVTGGSSARKFTAGHGSPSHFVCIMMRCEYLAVVKAILLRMQGSPLRAALRATVRAVNGCRRAAPGATVHQRPQICPIQDNFQRRKTLRRKVGYTRRMQLVSKRLASAVPSSDRIAAQLLHPCTLQSHGTKKQP